MKHQRSVSFASKTSDPSRKICRRSAEERWEWPDRHGRSGRSQSGFCAWHGSAPSTFTYWKRRERAAGGEPAGAFVEVPRPVVESQALAMVDATVLIGLPGGVRIEMSQATEPHA